MGSSHTVYTQGMVSGCISFFLQALDIENLRIVLLCNYASVSLFHHHMQWSNPPTLTTYQEHDWLNKMKEHNSFDQLHHSPCKAFHYFVVDYKFFFLFHVQAHPLHSYKIWSKSSSVPILSRWHQWSASYPLGCSERICLFHKCRCLGSQNSALGQWNGFQENDLFQFLTLWSCQPNQDVWINQLCFFHKQQCPWISKLQTQLEVIQMSKFDRLMIVQSLFYLEWLLVLPREDLKKDFTAIKICKQKHQSLGPGPTSFRWELWWPEQIHYFFW